MRKIIMITGLSLAGCGIFNRSAKTTDKNTLSSKKDTQLQAQYSLQHHANQQDLFYNKDSSTGDYAIKFWPRGQLSFNAEGAMSGEFDSIHLEGRRKSFLTAVGMSNKNARTESKNNVQLSNNERLETATYKRKKESMPEWKFSLSVILFVVGVLILLYKNLKKHHKNLIF